MGLLKIILFESFCVSNTNIVRATKRNRSYFSKKETAVPPSVRWSPSAEGEILIASKAPRRVNFVKDERGEHTSGGSPLLSLSYFLSTSTPRYLRSTSGTTTEPSESWFCSTRAGRTREVARPEPLRVWRYSILPLSLLTLIIPLRA